MESVRNAVVVALTVLFAAPPLAWAEPASATDEMGPPVQAQMKQAPTANPFGSAARAVGSDKLEGVRGGAELVFNDMKLHGVVGDNAAINTMSGANIVADGSFANAVGLPTVIQNSGSNVLIQNATIVNVQFKP